MRLPALVSERSKLPGGAFVLVVAAASYLLFNHVHLRAPTLLPVTGLDVSVPVVPWTVWVYASYPLLFVATFFVEQDRARVNRWLWATLAVNLVSEVVFILFPTTLDRALHPLPAGTVGATAAAFDRLHALDTPASCFPSLHVSTAYLSSFVFLRRRPALFAGAFLWANAIALSTLTTKQHYVVDVAAGLALALAAWWRFLREEAPRG